MENDTKTLVAADFVPLNIFEGLYPIEVDLVYAKKDHPNNHFPGLYDPSAQWLWVHKDLVRPSLLTALICESQHGWTLTAHDCLRPVEAQEKMAVYGYPPDLVSTPGTGAHPRGASMDFLPRGVDMGTPYDFFAKDLNDNPAARNAKMFPGRSEAEALAIVERRQNFENAVLKGAAAFGQEILPLQQEWWDFRLKDGRSERLPGATYWGDFSPVYERDLPGYMRLVGKPDPVPEPIMIGWQEIRAVIDRDVREKAIELGLYRNAASPRVAPPSLRA
ncbi:MAG: hypothetical protein M3N08_00015 [Pseudomonadota bacterium]|nr:hypothetical protein [Pseudomonadota bacterium]